MEQRGHWPTNYASGQKTFAKLSLRDQIFRTVQCRLENYGLNCSFSIGRAL